MNAWDRLSQKERHTHAMGLAFRLEKLLENKINVERLASWPGGASVG